ncbi:hypothetical protein AOQ84DRAFT_41566 [Glonium stellatum]|uniref:Uncharacterized protein n=1 Tax=Glonium stellatum TaxID=574774 RepID=A0A8E2F0Q5_9PEZI|nr:hypothetical protein AOQ84DRAFT_41566 [Glonium stellatum]
MDGLVYGMWIWVGIFSLLPTTLTKWSGVIREYRRSTGFSLSAYFQAWWITTN